MKKYETLFKQSFEVTPWKDPTRCLLLTHTTIPKSTWAEKRSNALRWILKKKKALLNKFILWPAIAFVILGSLFLQIHFIEDYVPNVHSELMAYDIVLISICLGLGTFIVLERKFPTDPNDIILKR